MTQYLGDAARATSSRSRRRAPARPPSRSSVAAELLGRRIVDRITVVAPTEHLKTQWAEAAARAGIPIDPTYSARPGQDLAGLRRRRGHRTPASPSTRCAMRIRTERFKTLVILDEVHHAGDALSWGEGVREAFEPAARRLCADRYAVPLRHQPDPVRHLRARRRRHAALGRRLHLRVRATRCADHVVRPVLFMAYSGEMSWRTRAGDEIARAARRAADQGPDRPGAAHRARPGRLVDPVGAGAPPTAGSPRCAATSPDAGGLVIATDQDDRPRVRQAP